MRNYHPTIIENSTLAIATLVFGIMAGFFWTYTFNVNLAMLQVDGETYASVQSLFNKNVRHFMFFAFFFGGGFFSILTLLVNWKHWRSIPFWLIAMASIIYIGGIIVFTQQINLPLNAYTESWNPSNLPIDWEQTRNAWNQANAIRVATSFIPFLLCVMALTIRSSQKSSSAK